MPVGPDTIRLVDGLRVTVLSQLDATDAAIVEAWGRAWNEIVNEWEHAVDALIARSTGGEWPPQSVVLREQRARNALKATREALLGLAESLPVTVADVLPGHLAEQLDAHAAIITSQLPKRAGTVVQHLDTSQLTAIVERTAGQVTSLAWPMAARTEAAMKAALVRGVAVGDNPRAVARDMLARVGGAFEGGTARALVIARTEIISAHREAAFRQHKANSDTLRGWVWWSALDRRTCPSCFAKHGTEHTLDERGPDDHQQGRCTRIPLTKSWRDLGFNTPEPADLTPNAEDVFNRMAPEDQLAIMGRKRLDLLHSGSVSWGDLASKRTTAGWRDSWAPTSVSDLTKMAAQQ